MDYIVAKLVTGETIVALAGEAGEDHVQMVYPFEVFKETTYEGEQLVYRTVLRPYCSFTDEQIFVLQMKHTIFVAPLKENLVKTYKDLVDAYNEPEVQASPPEESLKSFLVEGTDTLQ